MRILIPSYGKSGVGGGHTFVANFARHTKIQLTNDLGRVSGCDAVFIANPMWAERYHVDGALSAHRKIVLRLDNIPEDWNNRGTAISKLRDFIRAADVLVVQSEWAKAKYIEFMIANHLPSKPMHVIHNGVDTDFFTPSGSKVDFHGKTVVLYVKSSRNENKRYPEAMELIRRHAAADPNILFLLAGQFSEDTIRYNFGFYNKEQVRYMGVLSADQLAVAYRSSRYLLFPAYADAAPNTVLEAMASGVIPVIHPYGGGREFVGKQRANRNYRFGINIFNEYEGGTGCFTDRGGDYKPDEIRQHIIDNFGVKKMVDNYEKIIMEVADGQ